MGVGVRHAVGGILSLLTLIEEHREALEYDLIQLGLRLRHCPSPGLNWRDLWVICRRLGRDSELYRSMNPDDDPSWSVSEYLLAAVADALNMRLWQAGGGKGTKPKPVPRPTDEKPKQYGTAEPVEDIIAWIQTEMADMTPAPSPEERARAVRDDAIREALDAGATRRECAERFSVSVSTIGRVARAA